MWKIYLVNGDEATRRMHSKKCDRMGSRENCIKLSGCFSWFVWSNGLPSWLHWFAGYTHVGSISFPAEMSRSSYHVEIKRKSELGAGL